MLVTVVPSLTDVTRTVVVLAGSTEVWVCVRSNVETSVDVRSRVEVTSLVEAG